MKLQEWMRPADLAPGDAKCLERDWDDIELHRIGSRQDPHFEMAFGALWEQFGELGELESAEVLSERMKWDPATLIDGCALRYRMMLVTSGGEFAAARDHTAIVLEHEAAAVVHMSHVLVAPAWRRTGLAGWLRALPVATARHTLEAQGHPPDSPITLVGEMEHPDPAEPMTLIRLKAYEKAGFKKVDPERVGYLQPDFRAHHEIDQDGEAKPIPLALIIRRVGAEHEDFITGAEVRRIAASLYKMYGVGFRAQDMAVVHASLDRYPDPDEKIPLISPASS